MKQIIYSTSKTGNTLLFIIEIEGSKVIVTKGIEGGAMQIDTYDCIAKNLGKANQTTPEKQAKILANSILNKQLDKGYKKDKSQLKRGKTDASGRLLIMKAQKDLGAVNFPCLIQRKYDGMRCIAFREDNDILFRTKNGKLLANLDHLKVCLPGLKSGEELDGELYIHGKSLQATISNIKTASPLNTTVSYRVYDMLSEYRQDRRLRRLKIICSCKPPNLQYEGKVEFTPTYQVHNWDQVEKLMAQFLEEGYEGAILRDRYGFYEFGYRSYNLIKYKNFEENEFKVVGVKEATGRDIGTAIFICETGEGKIFNVRPRGTREQRAEWFNNPPIGKYLTVIYQKYTDEGIPFHPVGKILRDYE